ncbi:hypothetical protein SteCoe_4974 [Stentor coeruleus]|uniref:Uncharacterized protein n=1 Tax=Stentor coeruleus TaxID=5963 RepID=A0A1R2CTJ2_9CILI|nr:hypothetical protein SteCoe_4974 [Stentor coeruleus]
MLERHKWKRIPDRIQNAYSMMKKLSSKKLPQGLLNRSKLAPLAQSYNNPLPYTTQSSLNDYSIPIQTISKDNPNDFDESVVVHEEIEKIIKSSLNKYPNLAKKIKLMEHEKIPCKCSVFSNKYSLDRVHGFSAVACASDYCINRILEEPDDTIKYTKPTKYYSLSPERKPGNHINKDLILYEQDIDRITKTIDYVKKHNVKSEEYKNIFSEYIDSPTDYKIPRHATRSPNFSIPRKYKKIASL